MDPRASADGGSTLRRSSMSGAAGAWTAVSLFLAAASIAACSPTHAAQAPAPLRLRLTTGSPGAGFQPLGDALANAYRASWAALDVEVIESPGSVSNIEAIQTGNADLGFAFADVAYLGYVGRLSGLAQPLSRLRGIAVLHLTPLHLVVRDASNIHDIAELRGKRVGLGPPGSGTALTAGLVMQAFGLAPESVHAQTLRFNDAATRLATGTLDAMFVNASYPAKSVRAAVMGGAHLIPLAGVVVDRLRHDHPFLRLTKIPEGTYPGQPAAVHTVGVDTLLVCRSELDETFVYQLTRRFFEALPALAGSQESLRLMDLEQAPATPIPLHEGAARYYRERELLR
jgi:TRAP transporter TAXI family solute receptor